MPFNGPPRALSGSYDGKEVYCVQCGNIYVWADDRDCPTCTIAEELGIRE